MNKTQDKEYLFERMPVPGAVLQLSLPIVISSLVTILYNLGTPFLSACSTIPWRMPPSRWSIP